MSRGRGNIHWHPKDRERRPCLLGARKPGWLFDRHFGSKCLRCEQQRRWSAWGKQTLVSGAAETEIVLIMSARTLEPDPAKRPLADE